MLQSSEQIRNRSFEFGCRVARVALTLGRAPGVRAISEQLLKSGTAVGANLEEAKAASSRREFIRFVEISLREARETVYWIRVCASLNLAGATELTSLRIEGEQIARVLGAIVVNAKRNAIGT